MYLTISDVFEQTVNKYPDKEGLYYVQKDQRWTFYEWSVQVNRLANAFLNAGVKKGDRISTYLYNTSEFATAYFACAKIGAIFNPINYRLKKEELHYIVKDAQPKILLFEKKLKMEVSSLIQEYSDLECWYVDDDCPSYATSYYERIDLAQTIDSFPDVSEQDPCSIMYTSGTTGRPKGVVHRHRDVVDHSLLIINAMQYGDSDRGLVAAPLFNGAELHCGFFARVHAASCNVLTHHFVVDDVIDLLESERITTIFAVPTMWKMMLEKDLSEFNFGHLRFGMYGGEPMAPTLVNLIYEAFDIRLIQCYGMTEMGPTVSYLSNADHAEKPGSAGKPFLNHEIRVVKMDADGKADLNQVSAQIGEVGEIIIKGPSMMIGYYNNEEATKEAIRNGWYYSGDLGYFDQDGYLWISDRVNNMIVSGGENIYPREVEEAILKHPSVSDVAVIGTPDDKWGEKVVAFVVRKNDDLTEEDLNDFCRSNHELANYKRPKRYVFQDELPRSTNGKLQRFVLRELIKKEELSI